MSDKIRFKIYQIYQMARSRSGETTMQHWGITLEISAHFVLELVVDSPEERYQNDISR
jgi:hypothetical protein